MNRGEKRLAVTDSGTEDTSVSVQQQSNGKRWQQSKRGLISDAGNDKSATVTAFLAAALFHQNSNASSEEEEEGGLQPSAAGKRGNEPQMLMDWTRSNPVASGSNESEQEEGQIIRSQPSANDRQFIRISPEFLANAEAQAFRYSLRPALTVDAGISSNK